MITISAHKSATGEVTLEITPAKGPVRRYTFGDSALAVNAAALELASGLEPDFSGQIAAAPAANAELAAELTRTTQAAPEPRSPGDGPEPTT